MADENACTKPVARCFVCGGRLSHEPHELEDERQTWQYCSDCFELLYEVTLDQPQRIG
jgi:hypothetical protein